MIATRNRIPLDLQLKTVAKLVLRARVFYDIWWFFESAETRPQIIDTIRQYSELFRFVPHAHFVSFVIHIAALFEKRRDTISLPALGKRLATSGLISSEEAADVNRLLVQAEPLAKKASILRSNLFAHRSAMLSYAEAFKKADVTSNELRELTDIALKVSNCLLGARGFDDQFSSALPVEDAEAMLKALSEGHA